jgi:hypothetical protein
MTDDVIYKIDNIEKILEVLTKSKELKEPAILILNKLDEFFTQNDKVVAVHYKTFAKKYGFSEWVVYKIAQILSFITDSYVYYDGWIYNKERLLNNLAEIKRLVPKS